MIGRPSSAVRRTAMCLSAAVAACVRFPRVSSFALTPATTPSFTGAPPFATRAAFHTGVCFGDNAAASETSSSISSTARSMVRTGGLEIREEGATPTAGGMTLYVKAGPDGTSLGDCPFAHFVQMVLREKNLPYELKPSTQETKPQWLIDFYEGAMPALRHRKECYTESDVIAQYLDFFFQDPPLSAKKKPTSEAQEALDGFFPEIARYLKHTPDGDDEDAQLRSNLEAVLRKIEDRLTADGRAGPFIVGDGEDLTLLDCSLAPKLYHLQVGLSEFKDNAIDISEDFPAVQAYMDVMFARQSFKYSLYSSDTVVWGWSNARKK